MSTPEDAFEECSREIGGESKTTRCRMGRSLKGKKLSQNVIDVFTLVPFSSLTVLVLFQDELADRFLLSSLAI